MDHNVHRRASHARGRADSHEQGFGTDSRSSGRGGDGSGRDNSRAGVASQCSVSHDSRASAASASEHAEGRSSRRAAKRVVDVDSINDEAGGAGADRNLDHGGVSGGNVGADTLGEAKDRIGVNLGHVTYSQVRGTCRRVAPLLGEKRRPQASGRAS